jgi:hypothetical protein
MPIEVDISWKMPRFVKFWAGAIASPASVYDAQVMVMEMCCEPSGFYQRVD